MTFNTIFAAFNILCFIAIYFALGHLQKENLKVAKLCDEAIATNNAANETNEDAKKKLDEIKKIALVAKERTEQLRLLNAEVSESIKTLIESDAKLADAYTAKYAKIYGKDVNRT